MVLAKSAACLGIIFENENDFLGLAVLFRPALLSRTRPPWGARAAARLNFMVPWSFALLQRRRAARDGEWLAARGVPRRDAGCRCLLLQ